MAKKKEEVKEVAEFTYTAYGLRFTIPYRITVRDRLRYRGQLHASGDFGSEDLFVQYWRAGLPLIDEWTSIEANGDGYKPYEPAPDPAAIDIDECDDPDVAAVLFWAGVQISNHMAGIEQVPKN